MLTLHKLSIAHEETCLGFFQFLVIVLTCGFFGVGLYGVTLLKQEFNPIWFLPKDSNLYQWYQVITQHNTIF